MTQMPLAEHDHMIEALASDGADQSFSVTVLPRRSWWHQQYYNGTRTHLALAKDSPLTRSVQTIGRILPLPILGGLHHRYVRV